MLTETLVRLGKPFVEGAVPPADLIRQLTSIGDRAGEFYSRVYLVEVHEDKVFCHTFQQWGDFETARKSPRFIPGTRAVVAPVVIGSGGNPRVAQGRYAVPAYCVYTPNQIDSPVKLTAFLASRLEKTYQGEGVAPRLDEIVHNLHPALQDYGEGKCLIFLCDVRPGSLYQLLPVSSPLPNRAIRITESHLSDHVICADLSRVLDQLWWAKLEEGAQYGHVGHASCSLCGSQGETVSVYSKAWPWFSITWSAPFSNELATNQLHEAIGLCRHCSAGLSYGGKLFTDLSHRLPTNILRDAFQMGVETKSKVAQNTSIMGVALPFPILDGGLADDDYREDYVAAVRGMRELSPTPEAQRHFSQIVGFDSILPREVVNDAFRLSIYYYTMSNADVQMYASIEDIDPQHIQDLMMLMEGPMKEQFADLKMPDSAIPRLLARAYGYGYLWQALSQVLRRQPLDRRRFLQRTARALNDMGKLASTAQGLWELQVEAKFYAAYNVFWGEYTRLIGNGVDSMQTWQSLQGMADGPITSMVFHDVGDLGFIIGHLVRRFSAQFFQVQHKDFMRTRVMTFGSGLTPDVIAYKALARLQEFSLKLDMHVDHNFREQIAATLAEYVRQQEMVNRNREAFLAAFWAGYGLYGVREQTEKEEALS